MSINLIGICMLSDFLDVCAWFNKVVQLKVSKSPPEARCHGSNDQARASVNVKLDKHKHTCTHYTPRFGSENQVGRTSFNVKLDKEHLYTHMPLMLFSENTGSASRFTDVIRTPYTHYI